MDRRPVAKAMDTLYKGDAENRIPQRKAKLKQSEPLNCLEEKYWKRVALNNATNGWCLMNKWTTLMQLRESFTFRMSF